MVELAFELGINLLETFIAIEFVTRYLGCKYDDWKRNIGFIAVWIIAFIELSVMNHITEFESFGAYIPAVIYFVYATLFLKGSVFLKLWISVLIQILVTAIAIGTNLFVCNIIGYDPYLMITVFNSIRVISVIITKILLFYITRLILKQKYKNPLANGAWLLLIIIPIISIISLSALMLAAINHEEIKVYILTGMSCIVVANIITYYFFTMLNKDYDTKLKVKLLESQNENALKNIENIDAFVQQMKAVRHDMKNQLLIVRNYINSGKNDEAVEYINSLTDNYMPNIQEFLVTENDAFNAIVNSKIAICNQKGIYIEIKEKRSSLKDLDAVDTGVLFGNLLDNAIEAAEKTVDKRIVVEVQTRDSYLSILITNSINDSVLRDNKELATSKSDKELHGIGIKSVEAIVKKYDGMIKFYEENGEFCCHILLYIEK
ncbi:MAG: GHKL domain-containing protein [Lachnospiraceae bacterium]|nr:GHKL domain-containing protein [Lachnospiraceae bacterium]